MGEKTIIEITNDRLEEAIKEYATERTREKLTEVLDLLRPTRLLVPAMLKTPDQPTPCFLKNSDGEQFFVAYTSKEQIPKEPKSQAILNMPFPACNNIVVKPELKLAGIVINPFSDNLILKTELVQKLHEVDQSAPGPRKVKMSAEQFHVFVKRQVEFTVFPRRLFTEKEDFVEKLCDERERLVNQMFADAYKDTKLYLHGEGDYSVMALDIAEDLTLIRVDLPEQGLVPPLCHRVYITFNPLTKKAGYYTIEKSAEQDGRILGGMLADGSHVNYGEAPVEGAELQKVMELARCDSGELTS